MPVPIPDYYRAMINSATHEATVVFALWPGGEPYPVPYDPANPDRLQPAITPYVSVLAIAQGIAGAFEDAWGETATVQYIWMDHQAEDPVYQIPG